MKNPDTPPNEEVRLTSLQALSILDTAPEERFDRLTRMAKRLFGVPIALVSLVDENRQWFKSCVGLPVRETPRDISFCGHAILDDGLFIIPNTLEDERFSDNPLVIGEPHIRFYAGCPLKAPNGSKLGTLCIIDRVPRNFGRDDLDSLADLAAMVEREIAALELATMDELTNLSNRRGFSLLAEHSLNYCKREKLSASLIYLDLDELKPINDQFGHARGDQVLAEFSEQIRATFRDSDVIARLGGDEFAVLLTNTPKESARESVARLRERLEVVNRAHDRDYRISFSCGIANYDAIKHPSVDALLEDGDAQMYEEKRKKSAKA